MSQQGPTNNAGNESQNQPQERQFKKAIRRLKEGAQGAANKVVDTGATVANHPTTKDAAIGGIGGTAIAGGLLSIAAAPCTLPTAMVALGMGLGLGASAPVAGRAIKNTIELAGRGMMSGYSSVKNMFTLAPQVEVGNSNQNEDVQAEENTRNEVLLDSQRTVTFTEGRGGKRSAPARDDSRAKRRRATTSDQAPDAAESDAEEAVVQPTRRGRGARN